MVRKKKLSPSGARKIIIQKADADDVEHDF